LPVKEPYFRRSECLLAGYFLYAAIVAFAFHVRAPIPALTLVLNLTVIAGFAILAHADRLRRGPVLGVMRDWYVLALMPLCYREMGWFAQPHRDFRLENLFVSWDRVVLRDWGVHRAIEFLGPVVPSILEISYALVYALAPFSVAMLYIYRRRPRVDRFLFPFALGVLLCYVQFPFWPSEPPRAVFPGQDFPGFDTIFRRFNWAMLGAYGIHTSVFPSAHVAGAFGAAFAMIRTLPEHKWVGRSLLALAVLIATATFYGRYHYLADGVAGLAMCLVALAISSRW
jgi:hypothetical protein